MPKKIAICYLCGQKKEVTKDHIPPKCLAPKLDNSNFLYAPSCVDCRKLYPHEESKFRDFLAAAAGKKGQNQAADDALEASFRNFRRNKTANIILGKPNKDLLRVVQNIKRTRIKTKSGIYLNDVNMIYAPKDVNYQLLLSKIAKGIHYNVTKKIIPPNYECWAKLVRDDQTTDDDKEIFNNCKVNGVIGGFFHFRAGYPKEDINSAIYYLIFYRTVLSRVWFFNPKAKSLLKKAGAIRGNSGVL